MKVAALIQMSKRSNTTVTQMGTGRNKSKPSDFLLFHFSFACRQALWSMICKNKIPATLKRFHFKIKLMQNYFNIIFNVLN